MKRITTVLILILISITQSSADTANDQRYISSVQNQIKNTWNTKINNLTYPYSLKTILHFNILKDGSIANIRTTTKSGIFEFDKLAINSLLESGPFFPVDRNLEIIFNFEYNLLQKKFLNSKKAVHLYHYDESKPYNLEEIEQQAPIIKIHKNYTPEKVDNFSNPANRLTQLNQEDFKILATTKLRFPIDCKIGSDCYVGLYPVHTDNKDFACGRMAQSESPDTIFFLYGNQAHSNVLSALDGTVSSRSFSESNFADCGNKVVIDHKNDLKTIYCQLSEVNVKVGQKIKAGQIIARTGKTGGINYESLQFSIEYKGLTIDPFTANSIYTTCSKKGSQSTKSMWQEHIYYKDTGLIKLGISDSSLPEIQEAFENKFSATTIKSGANSLITWVLGFGMLKGDVEEFTIYDSNSKIYLNQGSIAKKSQRTFIKYFGYVNKESDVPKGNYKLNYKITREDKIMTESNFTFGQIPRSSLIF
jgi:murein DD-endopeptidase